MKKSKQKEMLEKLNEVSVRRNHDLRSSYDEFHGLVEASQSEISDDDWNALVPRSEALYEAGGNYAVVNNAESTRALDNAIEEMRTAIEYHIETEDD